MNGLADMLLWEISRLGSIPYLSLLAARSDCLMLVFFLEALQNDHYLCYMTRCNQTTAALQTTQIRKAVFVHGNALLTGTLYFGLQYQLVDPLACTPVA